MPYFKSTEEMYEIHRNLFEQLATHPAIGPELARSKLIISFKVHDPPGTMTIDCQNPSARTKKYFSYALGESSLKPDLIFNNSADFIHEFWQGKVNIVQALLCGKAKIEGNISQAVKLLPAIKPIFDLYPQILKEIGRADLIIS